MPHGRHNIDAFNIHVPLPSGKSALALFKATQPGTYTFYCSLHFDKDTGKGMSGTLIVAP